MQHRRNERERVSERVKKKSFNNYFNDNVLSWMVNGNVEKKYEYLCRWLWQIETNQIEMRWNEMKRMNERTNEVNDLQWNHVKIENSSWQPTQQWFYFSYFAFWLKIANGERNAEHTTNGWKLKLIHTRRSTLYFQPVWQINFLLSFTVSFRLLNIMHGIVSERVSDRASERVRSVYALLSIYCLRYHCRYWQISCTNYLTRRNQMP